MGNFNEYYSVRPLERKGALLNLTLSDRSDGKTFNIKETAVQDYLEHGEQTIHVRRYKTELPQDSYMHFMDDLLDKKGDLYGKLQFKHTKTAVLVYNNKLTDYEPLIYHMPLTMAGKLKSTIPVNRIKKIKFDEYIPLDRIYARGEMHLLLELWKSIDRDRDQTQLFCFGNAIDLYCPFIDYFGLPSINTDRKRIKLYKGGNIAVEMYFSAEHRERRAESRFSRLVAGTDYAPYDAGAVLRQYGIITCKIDRQRMDYLASFKTPEGEGSIWQDGEGTWCISIKEKRSDGVRLVETVGSDPRDVSVKETKIAANIRHARNCNAIAFESLAAFHAFEPLLRAVNLK